MIPQEEHWDPPTGVSSSNSIKLHLVVLPVMKFKSYVYRLRGIMILIRREKSGENFAQGPILILDVLHEI